jgi:hypothetical protein
MSKFIKGVKKLFIVEEEQVNENTSEETENTSSANTKPQVKSTPSIPYDPTNVNTKFIDVLMQSLEENNQQGLDYLEFKQSLRSLEKMPMDEAIKFHSAFAMAQSMGATSKKLIDSAKFYIQVLQNEEKKFTETLQRQFNEQVQTREEKLKTSHETIEEKKKLINELLAEIDQIEKSSVMMKQEKEDAAERITNASTEFGKALHFLTEKINSDIEKIGKFITDK